MLNVLKSKFFSNLKIIIHNFCQTHGIPSIKQEKDEEHPWEVQSLYFRGALRGVFQII